MRTAHTSGFYANAKVISRDYILGHEQIRQRLIYMNLIN